MFQAQSIDNKRPGGPTPAESMPQRDREFQAGSVAAVGAMAGHQGLARHGVGNQANLRLLQRQAANPAACRGTAAGFLRRQAQTPLAAATATPPAPSCAAASPMPAAASRSTFASAPSAAGRPCAACAQAATQTRPARPEEIDANEVPAIVHDVLHDPGQRLDASLRDVFEPRFGRDLSDVRVHAGARAAESARAVNAFAYTVGRDIVMAGGHYPPRTAFGLTLLAHELVHTLQQGDGSASAYAAGLKVGNPGDGAEREAETVSAAVLRQHSSPPVTAHPIGLSRWQITGTTATVDSAQDRLGLLPDKVKSTPPNWICIQPIAMRTAGTPPIPADFQTHYERYLQIGDTFDLSNLTAKGGNNSLRLSMLLDPEVQAALSGASFYPGMRRVGTDTEAEIAKQSGEGKTPLSELIMFGHSGGHSLYGDAGTITPKDLQSDLPAPTFDRAHAGKLPHRCWFTTDAQVRAIGCNSDTFGDEFSTTFLRGGGGTAIYSTLRGVTLPATPNRKEGEPKYMQALLFEAADGDKPDPAQLGPFSDAASFHASKYWQKTKGGL